MLVMKLQHTPCLSELERAAATITHIGGGPITASFVVEKIVAGSSILTTFVWGIFYGGLAKDIPFCLRELTSEAQSTGLSGELSTSLPQPRAG